MRSIIKNTLLHQRLIFKYSLQDWTPVNACVEGVDTCGMKIPSGSRVVDVLVPDKSFTGWNMGLSQCQSVKFLISFKLLTDGTNHAQCANVAIT